MLLINLHVSLCKCDNIFIVIVLYTTLRALYQRNHLRSIINWYSTTHVLRLVFGVVSQTDCTLWMFLLVRIFNARFESCVSRSKNITSFAQPISTTVLEQPGWLTLHDWLAMIRFMKFGRGSLAWIVNDNFLEAISIFSLAVMLQWKVIADQWVAIHISSSARWFFVHLVKLVADRVNW